MLNVVFLILLGLSVFFSIVSLIGHFRMKSFFNRAHAAGIFDSCGLILFILAFAVKYFSILMFFKFLFIVVLLLLASATSCHAICKLNLSQINNQDKVKLDDVNS